jgi:hypothetical protein
MNPKYDIYEWIDRYLNNEMSEAESIELEAKLRSDDDLLKTFEAQKIAHKIVIGEQLLSLKNQMKDDLGNNSSGGISNKVWMYLLSGAAILSVIALFFYQFVNYDEKEIVTNGIEKNKSALSDSSTNAEQKNSSPVNTENATEKSSALLLPSDKNLSKTNQKKDQDCVDPIINFSCQARGTCAEKAEGVIEIDVNTIKGVRAPFLFSVSPNSGFSQTPTIIGLYQGLYHLYVKDSLQCAHKLNIAVEVPTIQCENPSIK